MELAIEEAKKAYKMGEVPVGAVVVASEEVVIAKGYNLVEAKADATTHAELQVLQHACYEKNAKYLPDCTLYVTLEPCPMCAMACYWTQIKRLVFATEDTKRGYRMFNPCLLHPKTMVQHGIYADEARKMLQTFFQKLRLC